MANFKEHFLEAASVSECLWSRILEQSHLNCKILALMKDYKKIFVIKQFLRKALSLYFDFLLNDLQVQDTNA